MLDASTLALAFAGLFGVVGTAVAGRIRPQWGIWLLTLGAICAAVAAAVVLALLASPLVAQNPEIAEAGHWSVRVLEQHDPTNRGVAALALVALVAGVVAGVRTLADRLLALRAAARVCRALGPGAADLVVVAGPGTEAYAVAGRPGRIVVGARVLAALSVEQRRALLAHERAHLGGRHHLHLVATDVAAAVNPMLRPLRSAHRFCIERAADEAAAHATDRITTADALRRVAALRPATRPRAVLAAAADAVRLRTAALLAPPRSRPWLAALTVAVVFGMLVATVAAYDDTLDVFRLAHLAAAHLHRH